jgi:hypothetical protein
VDFSRFNRTWYLLYYPAPHAKRSGLPIVVSVEVDSAELSLHPFAESTEHESEETAKLCSAMSFGGSLSRHSLRDGNTPGYRENEYDRSTSSEGDGK